MIDRLGSGIHSIGTQTQSAERRTPVAQRWDHTSGSLLARGQGSVSVLSHLCSLCKSSQRVCSLPYTSATVSHALRHCMI